MDLGKWNEWDATIHTEPEQVKRQKSAAKADITPISIENDFAVFRGSKKNYETTLISCTCTDYGIRRLPCKHIYRLAHELGVFPLDNVKANGSIGMQLRIGDAMKIIESIPEDLQRVFHDIIYQYQYGSGFSIISGEDAALLFDKKLIKEYADKKVLLKKLKKDELLSLISDSSSNLAKSKKAELIDYVDVHFPSVYDDLLNGNRIVTLDDSVQGLSIAMNRRLCQKFPRESESWFTY